MTRLKIAILFGGCSEEHDISVKSAMEIASSLDTRQYEPVYIGITKAGV
nr:D-alanine-D-lactate ligase [uncultured bacterium]AEU25376.1 D-alanine-D-lactate ligase [uncultured bacterium]AEU25378.1 D-alanine-D-lactate ligase [uncultured bacterium]AEU25381.1 D-alanine-D-lactate ligase [uncultured bacterium]